MPPGPASYRRPRPASGSRLTASPGAARQAGNGRSRANPPRSSAALFGGLSCHSRHRPHADEPPKVRFVIDSSLEEAGFELRVPAREKRSFRAVLHGFPAIGPAPAPNPAEHRTLIAPGKRCRRIAGAHILAADADRPLINLAGGIRDSRERGARSTPPRGRIHRRRRCRRRVRATGAPFRRSCEHRPRRECASDRP